ncbi:MAG: GNAT family N-acetyltransferase [Phycisphaerales bacterium]|nr:GNAT family N-acetyltransferase [Phycisphaerales bacterium]
MANIVRLEPGASERDIADLAGLLIDAVESGAAVSFVTPLSDRDARAWWSGALRGLHARGVVLTARADDRIVGCVMLAPAWAPNQPQRAEVCKLLVHRAHRRSGLGRGLMHAVEDAARRQGFRLLTLDAKRGGAAEALYRSLGWTYVGCIPDFAVDTDGVTPHDAVIYYKHLGGSAPG